MVITMLSALRDVIIAFDSIVEKSGIDDKVFSAVLKIIGIGYLTEYSSSLANDAGCPSIAQKLQFGGKIVIFLMSISIVTSLIDVVSALASRDMKNLCFAKYQRFVCIGAGCARAKKRKMRAICACFALFFAITFAICLCDCTRVAYAQDKTDEELQKELSDAINGAIESLDLSELQSFLDSLSSESKQALSVNDVKDMLKAACKRQSRTIFSRVF